MASEAPNNAPLTRRWLFGASAIAFLLAFLQAPGQLVADTKFDLTQNPLGFLERASHQWSSQAPLGQVQNQAYGYFFPHGAFFSLGELAHIPPWITQRIWWALLLIAGFWGIIRVAEALGIGSRSSRIIAAVAFALSPRVLTTLGSISSETLPMMLAPWVLLPVILATSSLVSTSGPQGDQKYSPARLAAQSALAVALMGSVNAVATAAACLVAALWWASHRPNRRWWIFTAWWIPLCLVATAWWMVPLLLLGKVSPPFLDYIESSGVTTQWTNLAEVLRGTDSWTPFVSPERIAGAVLVTQPAAVLATGLIAAAGMAGLAMRSMPAKGRLALILFVGLAGLAAGYVGDLGSPIAEQVRLFLDSGGAPLRNVHKLEPLVRLPLVLGLAHLLGKVSLPGSVPRARWRTALAHPEREPMVALTSLILVALTLATSLAWTGKLAPRGAYPEVPGYWHEAADWLGEHAAGSSPDGSDAQRALLVPGAPFASQVWGLTRDEPMQALADTPWAVRDAVPLVPPGAIRALDSVQRLVADGSPSAGLAETLLGQGIGYVVVRNDLDPETSRSTRPALVHQAIDGSPGLEKVAQFGEDVGAGEAEGLVTDSDLRPRYPAVEIYRVTGPNRPGAVDSGPFTVDLDAAPRVQGGPESLQRLAARRGLGDTGLDLPPGPVLLAADAERAGLPVDSVVVTDTPTDRETDYGQVDNHSSALRTPDDPRRTHNLVPDYPVPGAPLVTGEWDGARITVSSSAADATQLGGTAPGNGPAATVDGDPATGWFSNGLESALGQWIRLDFDAPVTSGLLKLRTSPGALGVPVKQLEVTTPNGSTAVRVGKPGEVITVSLPPGKTDWLKVTATKTEDGSVGTQFGVSEISVEDYSDRDAPVAVPIAFRTVLPPTPTGAAVEGWDLGQELPGRTGCVDAPDRVRCSRGLGLAPEEPGTFQRTLSVPAATAVTPQLFVRSRQGPALDALLAEPGRAQAAGQAAVGDLRGSAFAATDGDLRTAWTASEDTTSGKDAKPTLTVRLPEPTLVTGLDLTPSLGALPAAPTTVAVDLGTGPQVRKLSDDEPIRLEPAVTDRIVLSLVDWEDVLDQTALGFAKVQPAGLAEIGVLTTSEDGTDLVVAGTGVEEQPTDRTVTVGCADGPTLSLAGRTLRASVTATVGQLRSGAPVPATVCADDTGDTDETESTTVDPDAPAAAAISLPAGRQDVTVAPGAAFFVDGLQLVAAPAAGTPAAPGTQDAVRVPTDGWTPNERSLHVTAPDGDRLLVVPESHNIGWIATAPDGAELSPVVVNGWQQGWIVPAGTDGTVVLEFPTDRWYRLGIFGGLLLLIPLLLLAVLPARRRVVPGPAPRTWHAVTVGYLGLLALATVIAGLPGTIVAALVTGLALALRVRRGPASAARILVGTAGLGAMLSAALLSTGPWRAIDGYVGHSVLVQLPALVAVVAVGLAALPLAASPRASRALRRLSQFFTARRTGSSTSA
ncbi:alpha-(1-_3)-arabinofuranosyltransferase domain-containing protein [Rhodococcus maanshanensis]|uniref:Arabinofuranan 3-O-arabinosyltransferase n=1 Tax=Rhodococcus maanshanensis TaxID=183556 RepID=A0A1H7QTC1_9NOCA|nr:arabinofuranan 3-O-arabinosyltransferase [Rhodococcus maanshanensis]